jgi:monomeric isocitrate dehydrogenase
MSIATLSANVGTLIKETSTMFKSISAIVITFVTIATSLWYLDNYVAHAADLEKLKVEQQAMVKQFSSKVERSADRQRKKYLEDKIFEYDQIPDSKHTQVDRALKNRYATELDELKVRLNRPSDHE